MRRLLDFWAVEPDSQFVRGEAHCRSVLVSLSVSASARATRTTPPTATLNQPSHHQPTMSPTRGPTTSYATTASRRTGAGPPVGTHDANAPDDGTRGRRTTAKACPTPTPENVSVLRRHFAPARQLLKQTAGRAGGDEGAAAAWRRSDDDDDLFAKQPVLPPRNLVKQQSYIESINSRALHFVLSPSRDLGLLTAQRNLALAHVMLQWTERGVAIHHTSNGLLSSSLRWVAEHAALQHYKSVRRTRSCDEVSLARPSGEHMHWLRRPSSRALAQMEAGGR